MTRLVTLAAAFALLASAAPTAAQDAAQRRQWNAPAAPFRIVGNVYYVGTAGLSSFLIADPKGLVVIDGGLPESAPLIVANIRRLGFRLRDIRFLLNNHSHVDHAGGLAALRRASGAPLVASLGDSADLIAGRTIGRSDLSGFPPVRPARTIRDGAAITVGKTRLVAHLTPGHTNGATSWSLHTSEGGKPIDVLFLSSLSVAGRPLVTRPHGGGPARDTVAVAQFRNTFRTLATMRADVVLSYHAELFDLAGKRRAQRAGNALAFVDPAELPRQVASARAAFEHALAAQRRSPQS
ncbi:metallo-beta-lactamase class B [Sphingomonas insulae]|uniref:CAU/MBL1b family subclass B3 metallo-beta-lactamase n=1 Tax=Sphingomonas insulae TaxID=424800 RepID=A0ABN1HT03_9SPHN|nr:subclass B3 metallo-beta-lactamase [Sphingomonas insulae]NIJ28927.1 metallo-beta-lactamase class B [Sphingomonas insulae]